MAKELSDVAPCSSLAVDSVLRVGTGGLVWGSCIGPYDARKQGLNGAARASYVAKAIGGHGFRCGLVGGCFSITRCGLQKYRQKNDWVNSLVGGAAAGAVIAAGTRRLTTVVVSAGMVSVFLAAVDYSTSL
ncbi:Outer envelope pore protein 16-4, chloroplastic [Linum grandiflorum]